MWADNVQSTYQIVRLKPGADIQSVQLALSERLPDTEILTHKEFQGRSIHYWLFNTGGGSALISGIVLGALLGFGVVAVMFYLSAREAPDDFAEGRFFKRIIITATLGYCIGMALALWAVSASRETNVLLIMTPQLAFFVFTIVFAICVFASIPAALHLRMLKRRMRRAHSVTKKGLSASRPPLSREPFTAA